MGWANLRLIVDKAFVDAISKGCTVPCVSFLILYFVYDRQVFFKEREKNDKGDLLDIPIPFLDFDIPRGGGNAQKLQMITRREKEEISPKSDLCEEREREREKEKSRGSSLG